MNFRRGDHVDGTGWDPAPWWATQRMPWAELRKEERR